MELTPEERGALVALLTDSRWAALATARDNEPLASWVAVAPDAEPGQFLLHLSHLSLHTRYLLANPRAALSFSEPDQNPSRDPQTLVRLSIQGSVETIARDSADYIAARGRYLARLPHAEVQFTLGDFYLMRFVPESARVVPGFGRAHRLGADALRALFVTER
jgi:putative heme iron utilization protein